MVAASAKVVEGDEGGTMTDLQQIARNLRVRAEMLRLSASQIAKEADEVGMCADALQNYPAVPPYTTPWAFPVGTPDKPTSDWYAYVLHDLTGRRNPDRYAHTGLDLNLDKSPWGNVDVGEPVFSVADGEIVTLGFSATYRGSVILKVDHFGIPLFVRYWHIDYADAGRALAVGDTVVAGERLGTIDEYPGGYAHLHFDMAWQLFGAHWWFARHPEIEWANPTYVLKTHLDPVMVDEMLARR